MPILTLSPSDQTLTATADTPLLEIYAALPAGLLPPFAPIELPGGLGGLVTRGGFGQNFFFASDILGLTFISPGGRRIAAGGGVVKNVQGYDLTRAFVGSFGVLGEALSVTLRLRPGLCRRHVAAPARLQDLPPARARFIWEVGGVVHLMHFGHATEVEQALSVLPNAQEVTEMQDLTPMFRTGMGVGEGGKVKDSRFCWVDGTERPVVPELFWKLAAKLSE